MASRATPDAAEILTVSALTQLVRATLEGQFTSVWVSGEISNLVRAGSGHVYLSLKDDKATLRAAIFRGVGLRLRFEPRDGMHVIARGRLSVYAPRGDYQLAIEEIQPKGIGALELALQQLRERLQARGYFDSRRKKHLPTYPRSIALVTSPTGAAIRDMLELLVRRWPVGSVIVVPVRVQGDGSALEIATAIRSLNQLHAAGCLVLDAMIVGRGGGSLEDLWAFNEEQVADAIFESRIPVISAVGHEIDVTIADLVADHRALTPSHAVTDLTPDREVLLTGLRELGSRLRERALWKIAAARQRVDAIADRPSLRAPLDRVRDLERKLDTFEDRMHRAVGTTILRARDRIESLAARLESLSPLNVLARGYSLTRTPDGSVIRDSRTLEIGDEVVTRLAAGQVVSRVVSVQPPAEDGK